MGFTSNLMGKVSHLPKFPSNMSSNSSRIPINFFLLFESRWTEFTSTSSRLDLAWLISSILITLWVDYLVEYGYVLCITTYWILCWVKLGYPRKILVHSLVLQFHLISVLGIQSMPSGLVVPLFQSLWSHHS